MRLPPHNTSSLETACSAGMLVQYADVRILNSERPDSIRLLLQPSRWLLLPKPHHMWPAGRSWALLCLILSTDWWSTFPSFILSTGIHFVKTPRYAADILATFIQSNNLLPSLPHYPSSPWNFLKEIVTIFLGFWFSDNSPIYALIPHFRKAILLTGSYLKPSTKLWYNVKLHKYLLQCLCHTYFVCVNCYA